MLGMSVAMRNSDRFPRAKPTVTEWHYLSSALKLVEFVQNFARTTADVGTFLYANTCNRREPSIVFSPATTYEYVLGGKRGLSGSVCGDILAGTGNRTPNLSVPSHVTTPLGQSSHDKTVRN